MSSHHQHQSASYAGHGLAHHQSHSAFGAMPSSGWQQQHVAHQASTRHGQQGSMPSGRSQASLQQQASPRSQHHQNFSDIQRNSRVIVQRQSTDSHLAVPATSSSRTRQHTGSSLTRRSPLKSLGTQVHRGGNRPVKIANGHGIENQPMRSQSNARSRHDEKENNVQHAAGKGAGAKQGIVSTYTNLEPKRIIGSGSFGYVFEAFDWESKQTVAVKRTQKAGEYVSREFEVLSRLQSCKHVVRMLDIYYSRSEDGKTAQNLIFEYCNRNLEDVIQSTKKTAKMIAEAKLTKSSSQQAIEKMGSGRISMDEIKSFMKQILLGMTFVHRQGIIHRDLKPENILMNENGVVKICDFGSAKLMGDKRNTPYIVSRYYRAPELILSCSDYGASIDVWAIGCIFAEFLTLRPLFPGKTEGSQLIEQIAVLGLPCKDTMRKMSSMISNTTIELVHKLDEVQRVDLRKILPVKDYPKKDIEEAADLIGKMLQWVPSERISCEEALKHPFVRNVRVPQ